MNNQKIIIFNLDSRKKSITNHIFCNITSKIEEVFVSEVSLKDLKNLAYNTTVILYHPTGKIKQKLQLEEVQVKNLFLLNIPAENIASVSEKTNLKIDKTIFAPYEGSFGVYLTAKTMKAIPMDARLVKSLDINQKRTRFRENLSHKRETVHLGQKITSNIKNQEYYHQMKDALEKHYLKQGLSDDDAAYQAEDDMDYSFWLPLFYENKVTVKLENISNKTFLGSQLDDVVLFEGDNHFNLYYALSGCDNICLMGDSSQNIIYNGSGKGNSTIFKENTSYNFVIGGPEANSITTLHNSNHIFFQGGFKKTDVRTNESSFNIFLMKSGGANIEASYTAGSLYLSTGGENKIYVSKSAVDNHFIAGVNNCFYKDTTRNLSNSFHGWKGLNRVISMNSGSKIYGGDDTDIIIQSLTHSSQDEKTLLKGGNGNDVVFVTGCGVAKRWDENKKFHRIVKGDAGNDILIPFFPFKDYMMTKGIFLESMNKAAFSLHFMGLKQFQSLKNMTTSVSGGPGKDIFYLSVFPGENATTDYMDIDLKEDMIAISNLKKNKIILHQLAFELWNGVKNPEINYKGHVSKFYIDPLYPKLENVTIANVDIGEGEMVEVMNYPVDRSVTFPYVLLDDKALKAHLMRCEEDMLESKIPIFEENLVKEHIELKKHPNPYYKELFDQQSQRAVRIDMHKLDRKKRPLQLKLEKLKAKNLSENLKEIEELKNAIARIDDVRGIRNAEINLLRVRQNRSSYEMFSSKFSKPQEYKLDQIAYDKDLIVTLPEKIKLFAQTKISFVDKNLPFVRSALLNLVPIMNMVAKPLKYEKTLPRVKTSYSDKILFPFKTTKDLLKPVEGTQTTANIYQDLSLKNAQDLKWSFEEEKIPTEIFKVVVVQENIDNLLFTTKKLKHLSAKDFGEKQHIRHYDPKEFFNKGRFVQNPNQPDNYQGSVSLKLAYVVLRNDKILTTPLSFPAEVTCQKFR